LDELRRTDISLSLSEYRGAHHRKIKRGVWVQKTECGGLIVVPRIGGGNINLLSFSKHGQGALVQYGYVHLLQNLEDQTDAEKLRVQDIFLGRVTMLHGFWTFAGFVILPPFTDTC
jgi:hypothetical protein